MGIGKALKFVALLSVILTAAAGFFTAGTYGTESSAQEIRVGSELEFPPYAFVDDSGRPMGFSVDLIRAVAANMGLSIKISTGTWNALWNDLAEGRLDALPIVAKVSERARFVNFSIPHTETYDAFFVRKGDRLFGSLYDATGKEIVVMRADAAHQELEARKFQGRMVLVDTIPEGLSLVASGRHDAFLCSKIIGMLAIKNHGIKGLAAGPAIADYKRIFSFAVKKDDTELLEKLNQGLLIVKTSGEYDRIYEKWLTVDEPWRKYRKYLAPAAALALAVFVTAAGWLVILQLMVRKRTRELAVKNEMLRLAGNALEERIEQRTAELSRANAELQAEMIERKRAEESLLATSERYRSYIDVTEQLGWTTNAYGEVVEDLPSWRAYTGQTYDQVKGWGWAEALHPADLKHTEQVWRKSVSEKSNYEVEYRIRRHDGIYRHFMARGIPVFKEDGSVLEWVGTCIDITERKKWEQALRESEERLRRAQEIAHLGSWELDFVDNILTWSDEVYRIFGLKPQEFEATYDAFLEAVHPDDRAAVDAAYSGSIREGRDSYEIEHRVVRKSSGEVLYVHEKCEHFRDSAGRIIRSVGMVHDITERKRAEQELIRLNKTLKALSDSSQTVIRVKEEQKYLEEICRIIVEDCGYSMVWIGFAEDDEAKSVRPVAHAGFEDGYLETLHITWADNELGQGPTGTAIRTGKVSVCRNMLTDPAFTPWRKEAVRRGYASSIVFPLRADDRIFGAISVYSKEADAFSEGEVKLLTELADNLAYGIQTLRIRAEKEKLSEGMAARNAELEALNKELEAFIYSISHDLRAPIRTVAGFARFLDQDYKDKLDDQAQDYIRRICAASGKITLLIDDLLRLSKISRQEVACTKIDLSILAASIISDLREAHPERNVEVVIAEGLTAFADRRLMQIVLLNLLGNAWKFTSKTESARIEFGAAKKDGKTVYYVKDNGAGFNPQYMEKIFWPFQRLHSESEFEGTGIGLTIVERITHRHGGKVWAEGEVGRGATIYFTMG